MIITGLLDFFKPKKEPPKSGYKDAPNMSGGTPFYSGFGNNIYASDLVVQSIRCTATEFKKLQPRHIVLKNGMRTVDTTSSIAKCLRRPNEFMTTAEFLGKIKTLLELNKNVFIYPQYYVTKGGWKHFTAIYPLKPTSANYVIDASGRYFIKLQFSNGYEITLPASDLIHWRKDYGVNDYFGGGMLGGNDNAGLLKSLQEYDRLTQSIAKAVECSCQINGVMKLNSYLDDDKMEKERLNFETSLKNNESGILFADNKAEYTHIPRDVKLVDAETIKFFHQTITRANGVSLPILNGDYTKAQKEAFYEHALESDITSLGQAFSKCVFTEREESFGNEIIFYPNAIEFMSMENKLAFAQIAAPAGNLLKDEFRALFGFPPLPDGQGQVISQGYNNLLDGNNNNLTQGGANNDEGKADQTE